MSRRSTRTARSIVTSTLAAGLGIALSLTSAGQANAATPIGLGSAESYAVLAGTTVTNTGPTVITGDLGLSPGSAVTGFPPGTVTPPSTIHAADANAIAAQNDLTTAYDVAAGSPSTSSLQGAPAELGGQTLTPGTYTASSSLQLTGTVTLDGGGGANASNEVWIFQAGSTLTTGSNSTVLLINGANRCNVFWQVGSSATLGTMTTFVGTIMALTSISATTGATIEGRLLARNGAVSLATNTITAPAACPASISPPAVARPGETVPGETVPDRS
ncbi:MAG: ice-binding family protein, partial [Lacisediminihabitans sp.]